MKTFQELRKEYIEECKKYVNQSQISPNDTLGEVKKKRHFMEPLFKKIEKQSQIEFIYRRGFNMGIAETLGIEKNYNEVIEHLNQKVQDQKQDQFYNNGENMKIKDFIYFPLTVTAVLNKDSSDYMNKLAMYNELFGELENNQ